MTLPEQTLQQTGPCWLHYLFLSSTMPSTLWCVQPGPPSGQPGPPSLPPQALPYTLRPPLPAASFQPLPTVLLWISFSASIGFLKGQSLIHRNMNISYLGCTSLFPLPPQGQAFSSLPPGHCPLPLLLTVPSLGGERWLSFKVPDRTLFYLVVSGDGWKTPCLRILSILGAHFLLNVLW